MTDQTELTGSFAGIDVGGTFTDLVRVAPDAAPTTGKVHSTPHDPSQAVRAGLADLEVEHRLLAHHRGRGCSPVSFDRTHLARTGS